jgi:hypothetical protein
MKHQHYSDKSTTSTEEVHQFNDYSQNKSISAEKELIELETFCLDFIEDNESDFYVIEDLHDNFSYSIEV